MVSRLVVLFISLTFVGVLETADICDILDANYCFYFSDSACYINLCQCEACSQPDKVQALLLDDSSNSTHESQGRLCPSWCGHLKSNETIVNILGAVGNSTTDLQDVSFECDDLKKNCLAVKKYNGHCYFFEKNCEYDAAISKRGKSKTHVQVSPLEQCLNFQKICAAKYKKHFACRQYRKKCLSYNLPEIHMEKSEVTQKPPNQHKKHMKKGHGMRKEHNHNVNETVVLSTDEIQIGNETLVETLLKDN